jgi:ADP-heptose:LPS heptosyltransferase
VTGQRESRWPDGDVLVLRALGLGDALTAVPALRGIRRAWPRRRLVLAGPDEIGRWLRGLGIVDASLATEPLGLGPDAIDPAATLPWAQPGHVAVNLHGRGPQSHRVLARTRPTQLLAFRCESAGHDQGPVWRRDEHDVDRWCRLLASVGARCGPDDLRLPQVVRRARSGGRPPAADVVLHPGASARARRWPESRWAAVAARLATSGLSVAVTGSCAEAGLCHGVVAAVGSTRVRPEVGLGLAGLAALVAGAQVLVCGDTGVAHLATGLGTASVLLFGPTAPARWGPRLDLARHRVLWHGSVDSPGDPHGQEVDPALLEITVDEVVAAVTGLALTQLGAAWS